MKVLTTALIAAGALALSACGGGAENNVAANNTAEEVYNVAPEELGNDTGLDNEATGNETADANATEADANASSNATNTQ